MRVTPILTALLFPVLLFPVATQAQIKLPSIQFGDDRNDRNDRRAEHRERCNQLSDDLRHAEEEKHRDWREGERREAREANERAEQIRREYQANRCGEHGS